MNYRLGLDVGTNSLGWSVLELDSDNNPCRIEAAGVRIFQEGRNPKDKATLKAERRMARSARRRRDRFKQRQAYLLSELAKCGLFPTDEQGRKKLQLLNPIELRANALTEKLPLHHIGRALFHLNQRRGFKSNRKDTSEEAVRGRVSDSVRALLEQMELINAPMSKEEYKELPREEKKKVREQEAANRQAAYEKLAGNSKVSYGAFLWDRQKSGKPTRARPASDKKLYDVYPDRKLLEDEFGKIWREQSQYHPTVLTNSWRQRLHEVIFHQRKLKSPKVGHCTYLAGRLRTFRAMPTFQRFRLYSDVNNLAWSTSDGKQSLREYEAVRDQIIQMLESPKNKKGNVSFREMKKCLKENGLAEGNFRFGHETPKRRWFDGNLTSHAMQHEDCVGKAWHEWPLEKQDKFISVILGDELEDEEVCERLMSEYGLKEHAAEKCMNAKLVEGTANLSLEAAGLLLEKMRDELMEQSSAEKALAEEREDFSDPSTRAGGQKLMEHLPYYGKAFQDGRHIILGDRKPEDQGDDLKFYGGVTNPTVHIALNQIRNVVNELIDRYGHPYSISIELGRELPAGKERRNEIDRQQAENQRNNEEIDRFLDEHELQGGSKIAPERRLRVRLWKELGEDPNDRRCPYSGEKITPQNLFSDRFEIDHIIPFSSSLDDGRTNKVLCTRQANRDKGQKTPFQAFSDSPNGYDWHEIFERAKIIGEQNPRKFERFHEDAAEKYGDGGEDFTARHLNDTRYIGRLAKEYLEHICPHQRIDVLTGRLTYLLRRHWKLNPVLGPREERKNRDDHRHHAVDAIVIGMTTRSILQRISTAANKSEDLGSGRLFEEDPWNGFRKEVETVMNTVVVSHKVRRKKLSPGSTDGQLHNETAYGIISGPDENEYYKVVWRQPVTELINGQKRFKTIADSKLRKQFIDAFEKGGKDQVADLAKRLGIRRLRCRANLKVIPIRNSDGHPYKAYKGDSNWGIEIYEYPLRHRREGEWTGQVISRFEANQNDFKFGLTRRPHPAAKLVMRLQINDCLEIRRGDNARIMRLQKLNQNGTMEFADHHEANVDSRNRDRDDPFSYFRKTANALRKISARKIHVSPTGLISYESRRTASTS